MGVLLLLLVIPCMLEATNLTPCKAPRRRRVTTYKYPVVPPLPCTALQSPTLQPHTAQTRLASSTATPSDRAAVRVLPAFHCSCFQTWRRGRSLWLCRCWPSSAPWQRRPTRRSSGWAGRVGGACRAPAPSPTTPGRGDSGSRSATSCVSRSSRHRAPRHLLLLILVVVAGAW
jgi:hypothetical protein